MILNKKNCYQSGGYDLIEHNEVCLPMSWQCGCNFDSGILISWDSKKGEDKWVQPMPTREQLHGFDCVNIENREFVNPVPINSLKSAAQDFHRKNGNVFETSYDKLFNTRYWISQGLLEDVPERKWPEMKVEAVANFGRGPYLPHLKRGCHEKEQQDDYSYAFAQSSWLLDNRTPEEIIACQKRIKELYDLSHDVWFITPAQVKSKDCPEEMRNVTSSVALISLRAEESLDRRVILVQGEYSTGQYSNNNGTNICSPVMDFTTADIWRLLSKADVDVNETYEKLYEVGIAPSDQRVGSLLNYAAVRQISTVKALEPDLYGCINARFQNVEFMSQFSRAGYYKVAKPSDVLWDGHNHIKAGVPEENIKKLSDKYEHLLKLLKIPYERKGNEFSTADPKLKGKVWNPFKNIVFDI